MKKSIALILVVTLLCGLLSGCGAKQKEQVSVLIKLPTLTMPTLNDPECQQTGDFIKKAWDQFAAQYEKYDVTSNIVVFSNELNNTKNVTENVIEMSQKKIGELLPN